MTFPRAVYKRGTYTGQIDHPGWLSKVVTEQIALDAAREEGWQLTMTDAPTVPAPIEPWAEAPTPTRRGRTRRKATH